MKYHVKGLTLIPFPDIVSKEKEIHTKLLILLILK